MTFADRIAALVQPVIDRKVEQARYEIENVTPTPPRAVRRAINRADAEADRRANGN